jgi:A/G-specific adenine glycosylase
LRAVPATVTRTRPDRIRAALLRWYEPRSTLYPWRVAPNPYRVLVSEVMLQQTQAPRVAPSFERFGAQFPDVRALAAASRADVLRAWSNLGYNRRAVALSEAARTIVRDHGGEVPSEAAALEALPGVGPYTAAAILALGFGQPVAAVDVNIRRVVARIALGNDGASVREVHDAANRLLDVERPAEWNQAVMDLGREICRPRQRCERCPIASRCAWRAGAVVVPRGSAGPANGSRRQGRYKGSFREVRGGVLRVLRQGPATQEEIATALAKDIDVVRRAIDALASEGAVDADEFDKGRSNASTSGRLVRLADG